jgi:hypothetical protein
MVMKDNFLDSKNENGWKYSEKQGINFHDLSAQTFDEKVILEYQTILNEKK